MRRTTKPGLVACLLLLLAVATGYGHAAETENPGKPIDINRASASDLESLPGVGPALAARIVQFRDENGPFRRVEDLLKVKGIGEKSFRKLEPHVTVGGKR